MKQKLILLFLLLSLCTLTVTVPTKVYAQEDVPSDTPTIQRASLFMAGDALLHGAVYKDAYRNGVYDFHYMMEEIGKAAEGYDLRYYNQETILGGTELGLSHYPQFNSPQEFGDTMIDYGFNLVSTATNHTMDFYEDGIVNSYNYWKSKENVVMDGTNMSFDEQAAIPTHEINGISYAFFSYTYGTNGIPLPEGKEYLVNVYTGHVDELLDKVRKANEMVDVVIVAMHWGTEYLMDANDEQLYLGEELSKAGADIIIGNHPHCIAPIRWYGDCICYFALGNMVSAQLETFQLTGAIAGVDIVKTTVNGKSTIKIENPRAELIYTDYDSNYQNIKVYLYSQLNDSILPNYAAYQEEYNGVLSEMDSTIQIGGVTGQKERKYNQYFVDLGNSLQDALTTWVTTYPNP